MALCYKKSSVKECQKSCQETNGCKRFVYVTGTHKQADWRELCCLKNEAVANYKVEQDIVSGPVQCPTSKFFICL